MIDVFDTMSEVQFNAKGIYQVIRNHFDDKHSDLMTFKKFMKLLRYSLTNLESGSPIGETIELLGRQKSITYLKSAYNYVTNKS
ncbi:unnamed protein product, partial [Medioppia subpectinata]